MNGLTRKMCILKQQKSGFSLDGTPVSGVARVEHYSGVLTLQLSLINFATLTEGRYVCILCDRAGERIVFPLTPGINTYKTERTPFMAEKGFCCMVVFLHSEAVCVAMGQFGCGTYSAKLLMEGLVRSAPKPVKAVNEEEKAQRKIVFERAEELPIFTEQTADVAPMPESEREDYVENSPEGEAEKYNDEVICDENYYAPGFQPQASGENGTGGVVADTQDATAIAESSGGAEAGVTADEHEDGISGDLFRPLAQEPGQSYYLQVKEELEGLFSTGKRVNVLTTVIPNSEWVLIDEENGCLVGLVYEELQVRYIAYALPAKGKSLPKNMEKACFVPSDPMAAKEGYFVLFQDAATGECVQASCA